MPSLDHPAQLRVIEAARRKGVDLEILVFSESTHTAADAARAVGADIAQIVKSLVFVPNDRERDGVIALVSGANRVDIARLAAVVAMPDLRRATADEAFDETGFVIGGIPPFGHRKPLRVIMDPDLGRWPVVWAAAGTPTAVFSVTPATLRSLANAEVSPMGVPAPSYAPGQPASSAHSGA